MAGAGGFEVGAIADGNEEAGRGAEDGSGGACAGGDKAGAWGTAGTAREMRDAGRGAGGAAGGGPDETKVSMKISEPSFDGTAGRVPDAPIGFGRG